MPIKWNCWPSGARKSFGLLLYIFVFFIYINLLHGCRQSIFFTHIANKLFFSHTFGSKLFFGVNLANKLFFYEKTIPPPPPQVLNGLPLMRLGSLIGYLGGYCPILKKNSRDFDQQTVFCEAKQLFRNCFCVNHWWVNASAKETSSIVSCFYFMDWIFIGLSISRALIWVYCINRPTCSL